MACKAKTPKKASAGSGQAQKEFAVIGLGSFGASLARQLEEMGHVVLGVDSNVNPVQAIADDITSAVALDATMAMLWRAVAVLVISLGVVIVGTWLLLLSQELDFSPALFDVVSAFSTTGLSLGVTGQLNTIGRLLIIAIMFWGRLGAITIMIALLKRGTRERLKQYPEETVLVG
jgi:hypothetical protein